MARRPRCEVPGCNEPKFYDGPREKHCLAHIRKPPPQPRQVRRPSPPSVVEESESSD